MNTDKEWVLQKIQEWEAHYDQALHELNFPEEKRAERELAGYRQWLKQLEAQDD